MPPQWPNITRKGDGARGCRDELWKDMPAKKELFSPEPGSA
jgi:hypothetical protein